MIPTRRLTKKSWVLRGITALGIVGAIARPPHAQSNETRPKAVKVTVLSTMLTDLDGIGEWGFAALVEADGYRVLFDTGARRETVLHNAEELKVDLSGVTDVVLSRHHDDYRLRRTAVFGAVGSSDSSATGLDARRLAH